MWHLLQQGGNPTVRREFQIPANRIDQLRRLRSEAFQELTENILPFFMRFVVDRERGGFYGHVANDRTIQKTAPKALVQHSRMLWAFAHVQRMLGGSQYAPIADHAREALTNWFWDAEHRGFYWMVDYQGHPLQMDKFTYGQAFAIYALTEDYWASGNAHSLERAIAVYCLLEEYCCDMEHDGYFEGCHRDWSPAPGLCVDETVLPVVKGMNTHLHVLEAYTNLLRAWEDSALRARLQALIHNMVHRILNPYTHHFSLFFDHQWRVLSDRVSYGHDIEGSWLLVEAAEVLGDPDLLTQVRKATLQMAYVTLEQAVDADGGLFSEGDPSGVTDRTKVWWAQAEAVVGFLNAYQLNGDLRFLDASLASWRFIREYIVDKKHGEWFWAVDEKGCPLDREKAGPWKAAYHNSRTCLEVMKRVQNLIDRA